MIQMNQLDFSYRKKKVFSGLDLTLSEGHVYGLLGKNGAGKSTLLKLMCGLLFPGKGRIEVMGHLPSARKPSFLSDLFFIPEEIYLPELKMSEYAKLLRPFYPDFDYEMLVRCMEEFEVSADEKMHRMSYGQRKKALICLGLASNARLLLMDEPTNGLDIPSKSSFRRLIASAATPARCMVISTHQVRDLDNLIDALVVVDGGRILVNATTERITEKLVFRNVREEEPALFAEESIRGRWGVVLNEKHEDSKLDMELFFNAVLQHPEKMRDVFEVAD